MTFLELREQENTPLLDWDLDNVVNDEFVPCPVDSNHPKIGRIRINDLHVVLPSPRVRDVMQTWHHEFVVSERAADIMSSAGLSGYELRKVEVTRIKRTKDKFMTPPRLWELKVTGWGGLAREESGIKLRFRCPACGYSNYGVLKKPAAIIDESQWDGSDFFIVWPMPRFVFTSERVGELFRANKLSGAHLIPIGDMQPTDYEFSPCPLWYRFGKKRALELGGPLGIA